MLRNVLPSMIVVAAVGLGLASPASGQPPMLPPPGGPMGPPMLMGVDPGPMGRVVKGVPFSADAVTTASQTLADGNRVERTFTAKLARDAEGRLRTEQTIAFVGPLSLSGHAPRLVTINDPIAGVHYLLDDRRKVALRRSLTLPQPPEGAQPRGARPGGAPGPPPGATEEKLGVKEIAGLEAEGTRLTTTIPAGEIGNAKPIVLVTERWVSTTLGVPVRIVRRDPRMGETVYVLTNVDHAEPAADLFQVPPGYSVQDDTRWPGPRTPGWRPPEEQLF